ncbi:MAG TPA: CGNR zinc finger domain-containing protein [Pilimelia sp.]|nr:CGNR zinc finger domain-containing protein [Pilimelia sp.]
MQVPVPLRLVESFLNSLDAATGRDELATLARFETWLVVHRRGAGPVPVREADLLLARDLRDALADLLRSRASTDPTDPAPRNAMVRLDALAFRIPLRARFAAEGAWVAPAGDGAVGVLGEVLAAVVLADHDGTLRRLKVCRGDRCRVAYYDWSKNGSRLWCSMDLCGNRSKTRAYRGRRREVSRRA